MKVILRSDRRSRQARRHRRGVRWSRPQLLAAPRHCRWWRPTVQSPRPQSMRRSRDLRDAKDRERRRDDRLGARAQDHHHLGQVRPEGKLYGSVTLADVAHAVEADQDRHRLPQEPPAHGAHQGARHPHGDRQAAQRRRVPDHRRGRQRAKPDRAERLCPTRVVPSSVGARRRPVASGRRAVTVRSVTCPHCPRLHHRPSNKVVPLRSTGLQSGKVGDT